MRNAYTFLKKRKCARWCGLCKNGYGLALFKLMLLQRSAFLLVPGVDAALVSDVVAVSVFVVVVSVPRTV